MEGRKRRKWDVAAPEGVPITAAHAGGASARGGIGTPSAALLGAAGVITAQGPVPVQPAVNIHAAVPAQFRLGAAAALPTALAGLRPGAPMDEETRARARQGAAAIVAKINQARAPCAGRALPQRAPSPRHARLRRLLRAGQAWRLLSVPSGSAPPISRVNRRLPRSAALGTSAAFCPARTWPGRRAAAHADAPRAPQELLAQGIVPSGTHAFMPGGHSGDKELGMDVTINDAPPDTRHFLTRRPTQARAALFAACCSLSCWLPGGSHEHSSSVHGLRLRTRETSVVCASSIELQHPCFSLRAS